MRLVILLSGSGTTAQALLDAVADGRIPAEIVAVGADKDCAGLERARAAGVEDFLVAPSSYSDRPSWNRALQSAVAEREPDQRARQRELDGRRRRLEVVDDRRQRRQVHVDRQRAERDQRTEDEDQSQPPPPGRGDDGRRGRLQGQRHERPLRIACIRQVLPGARRLEAGLFPRRG